MTAALEGSILAKVIAAIQCTLFSRDILINLETRLAEDLGFDSFDVMAMILHLEEMFDIEFSPDLIAGFQNVADVVRHLSHHFFSDIAEHTVSEAA